MNLQWTCTWRSTLAGICLLGIAITTEALSNSDLPSDSAIRTFLEDRLAEQEQGVSIVVGIVGAEGRRIIAHGQSTQDGQRVVDGDTIYEIGSITKVFTALLLADMVERGEVGKDDPVSMYLPDEVTVPAFNGTPITLQDLATHMSGLPRDIVDPELVHEDFEPYADFSTEQLYEYLTQLRLGREPDTLHEYSNLGVGLLGHTLSLRAATTYESLLRARILTPLGMNSSSTVLSPELEGRMAVGHDHNFGFVPKLELQAIESAGALLSSANDMLNLLEAALGFRESPLEAALAHQLMVRRPIETTNLEMGLGWVISKAGDDELIWHTGGTYGAQAFAGYMKKKQLGVVVLTNKANGIGVGELGGHLLNPNIPLPPPPKEHKLVEVDLKLYDRYIGQYDLGKGAVLNVTRASDRLFFQVGTQAKITLFPESDQEFFARMADLQVIFELDEKGRANGLTLRQNGRDTALPRIDK